MHRLLIGFSVLLVPIVLYACTQVMEEESGPDMPVVIPTEELKEQPEPPVLDAEDLITRNVTYTGILEEGGVTIYQEGSYRLMLPDGKMVLVEIPEGSTIDLDLYTGKLVSAKGDVHPTVEAGGTIMMVHTIHWIRREVSEEGKEEEEVLRVLCGGHSICDNDFICVLEEEGIGVCMEGEMENGEGEDEIEEDGVVEDSDESEESDEESVADDMENTDVKEVVTNGNYQKALELMIDEDYASERWTQEYCSAHVGFCIPVHKNWYYKSFGAMTSVLWRVEMSAQPVDHMGDGPLVVELKSGDLMSLGITDHSVQEAGSKSVGYRAWSENRYFQISAPADLAEPVRVITDGMYVSE